jgi:hypothetical protein
VDTWRPASAASAEAAGLAGCARRAGDGPAAAAALRACPLERLLQAALALAAWAVLGLALSLEPSPAGLGTHEQLGFRPCTFYQLTGRPCPGCGLTTAFAYMAHGRPLAAVIVQPFGAVLFGLTLAAAVALTTTALVGRSWLPLLYRPSLVVWLYGFVFLWLAGWAYKICYGQVTGRYGP